MSPVKITLILLIGLTSWFSTHAADFAVTPMMLEIETKPNGRSDFDFSVIGKGNGTIKITPYAMGQLESGHMGFVDLVEQPESSANWLEFKQNRYQIRSDSTAKIEGKIRVPPRAFGTHLAAVMVEEDIPDDQNNGILVKVRYAVILSIKVVSRKRPGRAKTSFANVGFEKDEQGRQIFHAFFTNHSNFDDWLYSEVQVRDSKRRLVGRFPLKTESAWQRKDQGSRVYPNTRVKVLGLAKDTIEPGTYLIMVRNKFGKRTQPMFKTEIVVDNKKPEVPQEEKATAEENGKKQQAD